MKINFHITLLCWRAICFRDIFGSEIYMFGTYQMKKKIEVGPTPWIVCAFTVTMERAVFDGAAQLHDSAALYDVLCTM